MTIKNFFPFSFKDPITEESHWRLSEVQMTIFIFQTLAYCSFYLLLNEVHSNYCKRVGLFFMQIFGLTILRFSSRTL